MITQVSNWTVRKSRKAVTASEGKAESVKCNREAGLKTNLRIGEDMGRNDFIRTKGLAGVDEGG